MGLSLLWAAWCPRPGGHGSEELLRLAVTSQGLWWPAGWPVIWGIFSVCSVLSSVVSVP